MRIIAGVAKGRRLRTPAGWGTRPMTERVREAVFSSIAPAVPGAGVLDLYAGTGSLGLEALSRGADRAVFVERDRAALRALRANVETVNLGGKVVAGGVGGYLASAAAREPSVRFSLVFVDPPYELKPARLGANLAAVARLMPPGGVLVLHRRRGEPPPDTPGLELTRSRAYGTACIRSYHRIRGDSG